ncbi:chromatin DNA-binding EKC/KEOPS complex subunit PCC1 NDAI_0E05060 [Naumovozyma dairenensis CBS 421]|uniref:Transcription factor Pcc1 n=1 Tax=Naumovozyma dairenensis (strain ATCC 10597 / BCRC 20456 / CBS 421 / NBRC 0211 / NRRL Y-12639) TaxID=1071378 RepID=G0WAQ0_NAUDC|nr:hypothetical protein NDAI_0E05060 [Naumovozyma dairenensis CBS 421]CCD25323.1 hypothetical protein NDAI_0E05060 [Naumovozyma dairenensis CBS 421]
MRTLDYTLEIRIPFPEERMATIAQQVLSPDPILKPEDFQVEYLKPATQHNNVLLVKFQSIDERVLRVGVSSVLDSIKTILETMDEL